LKQTTKDEMLLVLWRLKVLYKPGKNFVQCSHLTLPLFLSPRNCWALFVDSAVRLSFAATSKFHCDLPSCERK